MSDENQVSGETREYGDERIEVIYRDIRPAGESGGKYPDPAPGEIVEDGILMERDVVVTMRDGVNIYTDIYRPEGAVNVPAIVAWSPYGKRAGYMGMPVPGVPPGTVSPMAKFEGPDPAYWCRYGYAIINPDARGFGHSEGDGHFFSTAEGRDCSDLIEWVAALDWCSGKVAMSGNSWLAMLQWFTAAERPPHLAAISPWEGSSDIYRNGSRSGGIPEVGFAEMVVRGMFGPGRIEDMIAMIRKYPFMNGYWEDKIARVEKVKIPAYVVACYTSIHTHGTFDAYRRLSSPVKWLRVHNTQEWPDYYTPENLEDLRRFFDRYLKGIRNGWELTPRVRLSVLDPGGADQVNRPENEWPLARTQYEKLFLDGASGALSPSPVKKESLIRYRSDDGNGQAAFTIRFDEDTELTGYMKLRLWVEAEGSDDMDLFVYVGKLDEQGRPLHARVLSFPFPGAQGLLRVSNRELDEARSTPSEPYHLHRREKRLNPGEIVPVEVGLWPLGMFWHAGQQLQVVVQGHNTSWMDGMAGGQSIFKYELRNRGDHIIHTGGKYDAHLLVPKIPL